MNDNELNSFLSLNAHRHAKMSASTPSYGNCNYSAGGWLGTDCYLRSMNTQLTFTQSAPRIGYLITSGGKLSPAVRQLFTLFPTICPQPPITE